MRRFAVKAHMLKVSAITAAAVLLLLSGCGAADVPAASPSPAASPEPEAFISGMDEAEEMLSEVMGPAPQYTVLDYAASEDADAFVEGAILYRDAGKVNEGSLLVYTKAAVTTISYGEADDPYNYDDDCAIEITGGDTIRYSVRDMNTGYLLTFGVQCSVLEDGTPHFKTVDSPSYSSNY